MADVLDSLVEEYQRRIIEEKQALQQAENARTTAMRNIDRIEGAALILVGKGTTPKTKLLV